MKIREPDKNDFLKIRTLIELFELDNRQLLKEQFLATSSQIGLIGFGRIRDYTNCSELCSLGVIEPQRYKGIGKQLVKALIQKAKNPLYLVCVIPDFFEPLGFTIVKKYPDELKDKLEYCTSTLVVEEKYVVMKHEKSDD